MSGWKAWPPPKPWETNKPYLVVGIWDGSEQTPQFVVASWTTIMSYPDPEQKSFNWYVGTFHTLDQYKGVTWLAYQELKPPMVTREGPTFLIAENIDTG